MDVPSQERSDDDGQHNHGQDDGRGSNDQERLLSGRLRVKTSGIEFGCSASGDGSCPSCESDQAHPGTTPRISSGRAGVATVSQATEESNVSEPEERQDGVKPDSDPSTGKSDADRAKDKEQEMEESGEELPG
jgi:hypothetical protein